MQRQAYHPFRGHTQVTRSSGLLQTYWLTDLVRIHSLSWKGKGNQSRAGPWPPDEAVPTLPCKRLLSEWWFPVAFSPVPLPRPIKNSKLSTFLLFTRLLWSVSVTLIFSRASGPQEFICSCIRHSVSDQTECEEKTESILSNGKQRTFHNSPVFPHGLEA